MWLQLAVLPLEPVTLLFQLLFVLGIYNNTKKRFGNYNKMKVKRIGKVKRSMGKKSSLVF